MSEKAVKSEKGKPLTFSKNFQKKAELEVEDKKTKEPVVVEKAVDIVETSKIVEPVIEEKSVDVVKVHTEIEKKAETNLKNEDTKNDFVYESTKEKEQVVVPDIVESNEEPIKRKLIDKPLNIVENVVKEDKQPKPIKVEQIQNHKQDIVKLPVVEQKHVGPKPVVDNSEYFEQPKIKEPIKDIPKPEKEKPIETTPKYEHKESKTKKTETKIDVDLSNASTGVLSKLAKQELKNREESSKYIEKMNQVKRRNIIISLLIGAMVVCGGGLYWYFSTNLNNKEEEAQVIKKQVEELQNKLAELESSEDSLKKTLDTYMKQKAYNKVIQTADRIHDEYPDSETDKYAKKQVKKAKEKLEKLGMETGNSDSKKNVKYEDYKSINFDKLSSNSKNYLGEKGKFYGKVIQLEQGKEAGIMVMRLAVDDDINKVIVVQYEDSKDIDIEEDDYVNTGGIIVTDLTYKTVLGTKLTVPAMSAVYVDKVA